MPNDSTYIINHRIVSNNAQANGSDINEVVFSFNDGTNFEPIVGLEVVIRASGNALIKESNSSIFKTTTDGAGNCTIHLTDLIVETVTVEASVLIDPSKKDEVDIIFIKEATRFYIKDVLNQNHSFTTGQPTIAWKGASFVIVTSGGIGDIEWEVTGAPAEVVVEGNTSQRTAGVTIKNGFNQACIIKATDTVTGEMDEFIFNISTFIQPEASEKVSIDDALHEHKNAILSIDTYHELFNEWGDMSSYANQGWSTEELYWTDEYWIGGATVFDLSVGTTQSTSTVFVKKYYAFVVGA